MTINFLVPWRDTGCEARQRSLATISGYYSRFGNVILSDSAPGVPFNVSEARNNAVNLLDSVNRLDGRVLVFLDADAFVPINQIREAIKVASTEVRLVKPFTWAGYLTQRDTETLWGTGTPPIDPVWINPPSRGFCGLAWVLDRDLFDRVGRFDEEFIGYGGEDNAFQEACELHAGPKHLIQGWAYSLWHPATRATSLENLQRLKTYRTVSTVDEYNKLKEEGTL